MEPYLYTFFSLQLLWPKQYVYQFSDLCTRQETHNMGCKSKIFKLFATHSISISTFFSSSGTSDTKSIGPLMTTPLFSIDSFWLPYIKMKEISSSSSTVVYILCSWQKSDFSTYMAVFFRAQIVYPPAPHSKYCGYTSKRVDVTSRSNWLSAYLWLCTIITLYYLSSILILYMKKQTFSSIHK